MRYCIRCGNALSAGASFCHSCGAALKALVPETDETPVAVPVVETVFEVPAAEPVVETVEEPVVEPVTEEPAAEPVTEEPVPVVIPAHSDKDVLDERAFLDQTHRLLRWERKAWSISGKVFLIMGIVFAALFFLLGILMIAVNEGGDVAAFGAFFFTYALVFGCMFIAIGVINIITAGKIPQYTDTLYRDFRAAHTRCNSIGMIVFGYFFNTIALVFYVINFVRMKTNKAICKRILTRQGFPN